MAKFNKNVGSADVVKTHVQGGVLEKSPPARPVGSFMSKNIPAGTEGTNSGPGRKGMGK